MCGFIAGMASRSVPEDRLQKVLKLLKHRGPDDSGLWLSKNHHWFMGHTRLSIVGLGNGHQPMTSSDGAVHMVVNGEFYGHQKIRADLIASGVTFATHSDSEIALHLYRKKGMQVATQLRGEFAMVIADESQNAMFAIRDRFGIKPLFYSVINGNVFFASEIKALLALGVPSVWNKEAAYHDPFLTRSSETTLFKNIYAVPPGCYAMAKDGRVRIYPYWDWEIPKEVEFRKDMRSSQEVINDFRNLFTDAIKQRLSADVEVGCYLSGGIDSCSVAGFAQQQLNKPLKTFTLSFDNQYFDESAVAKAQAKFIGAENYLIPVKGQDIADAFADAIWHIETPVPNSNSVAKFLLSRFVRDLGIKVVLTGEGADEMLGGYMPFRRDAILHSNSLQESEKETLLSDMFQSNSASRAAFMRHQKSDIPDFEPIYQRLGWLPSFMESYGQMGLDMLNFYRDNSTESVKKLNPFTAMFDTMPMGLAPVRGRDKFHQALYLNSKTFLPNAILGPLSDRVEMAHSVEGRLPFLDHHLAEFIAGVPVEMKIRGSREKHILREAAKNILIPEVYNRQKHPFLAPPVRDKNDPIITFYRDTLSSQAAKNQPIFDPAKALGLLGKLIDTKAEQRIVSESHIVRMASIAVMQEKFRMSDVA